jgi:hypothetical protein
MQRSLRRIVSGAFAPVVTRHKVVRGHAPSCTVAGEMGGLTTAGRIGLVPGGTLEQTRNLCERCCTPTAHTHRYSIDLSEFRKMKTDRGSATEQSPSLIAGLRWLCTNQRPRDRSRLRSGDGADCGSRLRPISFVADARAA